MTALQIGLAIGLCMAMAILWSMHRSPHPFDIRDALMDKATGEASLNALVITGMALLSAWVVVDRQFDGKDDVGSILLGVLGIFVGGRVLAQGISAYKPPAVGGTVAETSSKTVVTTTDQPIDVKQKGDLP